MKTLRQHLIVLGALCGAAIATYGTDKIVTTATASAKPGTYQRVSALQVFDTMKGNKRVIDWTCYVDFSGGKPASRTTAWLEADFQVSANGIDLWDVGAQHRTHQLWVRLVTNGGHTASLTQVTDSRGQPVNITPPMDANGFYLVEGALPSSGKSPVNSYVITTDDPKLHLDVQYVGHEAGTPTTKQIEDGGPPSVPPVNEN